MDFLNLGRGLKMTDKEPRSLVEMNTAEKIVKIVMGSTTRFKSSRGEESFGWNSVSKVVNDVQDILNKHYTEPLWELLQIAEWLNNNTVDHKTYYGNVMLFEQTLRTILE